MKTTEKRLLFGVAILVVIALATWIRLTHLDLRPIHHDEGINGWTIAELHDRGIYIYDPHHYHGPTFIYWGSVVVDRLGLNLTSLRTASAISGLLLCLLPLLCLKDLGYVGAAATIGILAFTPASVFFSRYAIHESLFVLCVNLAAVLLLHYLRGGLGGLILLLGLTLGYAAATKETVVLNVAALCAAVWCCSEWKVLKTRFNAPRLLWLGSFFLLAVMSWFGVDDAREYFKSYFFYWKLGSGELERHVQGPMYFIMLLTQAESLTFFAAIAAAVVMLRKRAQPFERFWMANAAATLGAYSLVPYKTPWLVLNMVVPMAFVVGAGVRRLSAVRFKFKRRALGAVALGILCLLNGYQAWLWNFRTFTDATNPYCYIHCLPDVHRLEARVNDLCRRNIGATIGFVSDKIWPFAFLFYRLPCAVFYYPRIPMPLRDEVIVARSSQMEEVRDRVSSEFAQEDYQIYPTMPLHLLISEDLEGT